MMQIIAVKLVMKINFRKEVQQYQETSEACNLKTPQTPLNTK